jgi:hypothetical protein
MNMLIGREKMCVKTLPIIQDDASSSAPRQFADVEPDNSIPEINVGVNTRSFALR